MIEKPLEAWRARATVSEALDYFDAPYMQDVWSKALARRATDPEGAVTAARTLLESVCKFILESAQKPYRDGTPLPELYKQTAKVLNIAPSQDLAPLFNSIFQACADVIQGIGALRNELSDSHGRGPFGEMPTWRHAELAVNLSGAMATYLAAIWKARQPTVADVIRDYLDAKKFPPSHRSKYVLPPIADAMRDVVATKVRPNDIVTFFEERASAQNWAPATLRREFATFRAAMGDNSKEAFNQAANILKSRQLLPTVYVPIFRRISEHEFNIVREDLLERAKRAKVEEATGIIDVMGFSIWSGRKVVEILSLRWDGVNFQKHTCKLPGKNESFPVLEEAWKIIEARRSNPTEPNGRIFPYDPEHISVRHRTAIALLIKSGKLDRNLRFHDYAFEAVHRLLEAGNPYAVVASATGQPVSKVSAIAHAVHAGFKDTVLKSRHSLAVAEE